MCKCECCNKQAQTDFLKSMLEEGNRKQIEIQEREEFVSRNFPVILEYVNRYNELIKQEPQTAHEAQKQNDLIKSIARQICKYVQ